jgi:transposase
MKGTRKAAKIGRPLGPRPARADLARLYKAEGKSIREAARILGVSKDAAARALEAYGLKPRANVKRSRLRAVPLAELWAKIKAEGYQGAALAFGVNHTTLRRYMAGQGGKLA